MDQLRLNSELCSVGYFSHYLERMSTNKQRKIKEEIQEGYRPALTVDNIIKAIPGLEWNTLGQILGIPASQLDKIAEEYPIGDHRVIAVVKHWPLIDPLISWRRIIHNLDEDSKHEMADKIRHYAEELTDTSLSHQNVIAVLATANMYECLYIPLSVIRKIGRHCSDKNEERNQLVQYWRSMSPYASWSLLAGRLLWQQEETALAAAKRFIQKAPESSLTLNNLTRILEGIDDPHHVAAWLAVDYTKLTGYMQYNNITAYWEYFLNHHPAPSWKVVAIALWRTEDYETLEKVMKMYLKSSSDVEMQRKLDACRQATREKGAIDQIIMQGIFLGLPCSGKTSTKRRLLGKRLKVQQSSTGVAEKVSHVEIEKTTVHFNMQSIWNEVTNLSEETAIVVDDISDNITKDQNTHSSNDNIGSDIAITTRQSATPVHKGLKHTVVHKIKALFQRKKKTTTLPSKSDTRPSINPIELLDSALRSAGLFSQERKDLRWMLYLSDVGGQPEFQEMLPALVSGPSLYFLTFPLHKGLNEKCIVEYQHPNGSSIIPYTASFTIKEALLSSLASIVSTRSYIKVDDGKTVFPKIFFIATHRDKLESEQQLMEIDRELQEAVERTAAYTDNMIEFQSIDQMVFDLDNTSDSQKDIQRIRRAVERIGTRNQDYRIQTPYTWMIFAITIRHHSGRVLSFDECAQIGKVCGIETHEELNNALWFLHHNVGIIRHFQNVPDLQDIVFIDPQYIFDKLTELIISTFTFEAVGHYTHKEFMKKGIIPANLLKNLSTESDDNIDGDKFAILMEHLNIVTPIEENGKIVKYFAPCALSHAELPPTTASEAVIPPLQLTFESGYCPKGIFGSLVVKLLKKDKSSQFEWKLKQDRIYRNQICLSIGPYHDSFEFSLFPAYINIALSTSIEHHRKIPLGYVCCDVRRKLEASICAVTEALHYTERAAHCLAFACPEPSPHDRSHAATINFSPDGTPCTLNCPVTHECYKLPNGYMFWFDENMCLPAKSDNTASRVLSSGDHECALAVKQHQVQPSSIEHTTATKERVQLEGASATCASESAIAITNRFTIQDVIIKAGISRSNILEQECSPELLPNLAKFCVDWKLISFHLKLTEADIAAVDGDNRTIDEKRIGMLMKWREKLAFEATYRVLVQALLNCGRMSDALDVCKAISSSAKNLSVCEIGHLSTIFRILLPLASDWENIGLCLGLDNLKECIDTCARTEASCLRGILKLWLSRVDPPPTLNELVKAVKPFDPTIAAEIKYL